MDTNSPQSPKRALTAERKEKALLFRIGGKTFAEIGAALGISPQAAYKLVANALDDISQKTAENAEQLRRLEIERLDFMRNAIWGAVIKGDVVAVDRGIKISKRISELMGLDAPVKTDITSDNKAINPVVIYIPDNGRDKRD